MLPIARLCQAILRKLLYICHICNVSGKFGENFKQWSGLEEQVKKQKILFSE